MRPISVEIRNEAIDGKRIRDVKPLLNRAFVISRIRHTGSQETELANADTVLHMQDEILFIANPKDVEAIVAFFGRKISVEWEREDKNLISRRILITKPELNGKSLSQLRYVTTSVPASPVSTVRAWIWWQLPTCSCRWETV